MTRARLALETLERREVPAQFGIPWANPTALTVSFAPDGTDVDGSASELYALMAESGLSEAVWQREILRAFQAWAAQANLNFGVVADNGAALGAAGLPQAHAGFGDIRIFAAPLADSCLAITTPPGDLAGTRTGDIILNSNYNFGVGTFAARDLYTVFLQEAGHALGVGNSPNTNSVMYEFYQGTRSGLISEDVTRVRALYGARPTNTWEPTGGNNAYSSATVLAGADARVTYGDVASVADADWYSFVAAGPSATVWLNVAGQSLLAGRVAVYNTALTRLGCGSATAAGQDIVLALSNLTPGVKYFIRVDDATNVAFDAGQYLLKVASDFDTPETITLAGQAPADDAGSNESFLSATRLSDAAGGPIEYREFARLRAGDVDVYRVRAPFPGMNQENVLTATVRAFGDLAPKVTVSNFLGLPVSSRLVADGNGLYTVVVTGATANADYHIAVESRTGVAGDYEMRATFRSQVTSPHVVESGALVALLNPSDSGSIQVTGSAQIYFRLSSALTPILGPSVVLRVYDGYNRVKFHLLARAGETVDGVALLGPGQYRVEITANGFLILPNVLSAYTLSMALLTDPTGVTPSDPNEPGGGGGDQPSQPPSGYNYYNDRGYYVWGEATPSGGS